MFILRRINSAYVQSNTLLGDGYVLVMKESNENEFTKRVKAHAEPEVKELYGLIVYENGTKTVPLYRTSHYYLMTSDGKTFDNISNR